MPVWLQNILTAADNQTYSSGRVLGFIVFCLFLIVLPSAAVITVGMDKMTADEWAIIFDKLTTYVPATLLAIGGTIGLTSKSDTPQ